MSLLPEPRALFRLVCWLLRKTFPSLLEASSNSGWPRGSTSSGRTIESSSLDGPSRADPLINFLHSTSASTFIVLLSREPPTHHLPFYPPSFFFSSSLSLLQHHPSLFPSGPRRFYLSYFAVHLVPNTMAPPPLVLDTQPQFRRSPGAVVLPLLAFLAIVLIIPPGVWHARNRNVAACSLLFWITLSNVFVFINALIWPTDDISRWWNGVGLCDIQVKLTWAFSVGAACSLACIMRNLSRVLDVDRSATRSGSASRKRQTIIDLLWCFACPIFVMAVDYIVQSNRYYIFTIAGCTPAIDESWLAIVLVLMWAPLFCVIASYYCSKWTSSIEMLTWNRLTSGLQF